MTVLVEVLEDIFNEEPELVPPNMNFWKMWGINFIYVDLFEDL